MLPKHCSHSLSCNGLLHKVFPDWHSPCVGEFLHCTDIATIPSRLNASEHRHVKANLLSESRWQPGSIVGADASHTNYLDVIHLSSHALTKEENKF